MGITVPLDKGLPEEEIENLLKRSRAEAIIFDSSYKEIMEKIKDEKTTYIKEFICMEKEIENQFISLEELIIRGKELIKSKDNRYIEAEIDHEKVASIVFTSGTTAMSKAAMLSHKNYTSNIYDITRCEKLYSYDINMAFLPFHHTLGSTRTFGNVSKWGNKCIL